MKLFSVVAAACVLTGCAAPVQPLTVLTPEFATTMPTVELCVGVSTYRPSNAVVAQQELVRRGVNCADHTAAMQAFMQQQRTVVVQQPAPAYQPIPMPQITWPAVQPPAPLRSTNCTSQRIGNQVWTNCQ